MRATTAFLCLASLMPVLCLQAQTSNPYRTVIDTEPALVFQAPSGYPWSDLGAYVGAGRATTELANAAIKAHYSHFNHFASNDPTTTGFPYSALRNYEAQEVAAGRAPIFITATYKGKKRPVLFLTYLVLDSNGHPTAPSNQWAYAVNVSDPRYIKFWLNQYARPVVLEPMTAMGNVWVYLDGCAFSYAAYGVLDDNNKFVGGIPWDSPFPANPSDYLKSIGTFFSTVKQLAPDIKFMTDVGTMSDPSQFETIYASIPGAFDEDTLAWYTNPTQYMRDSFYNQIFPWFSWLGTTGRVAIMGAQLPSNWTQTELVTGFVVYELVKGRNFFFAPRDANVPPADWESWNAALGDAVSALQESAAHGDVASRLYSRQFGGGYVYLNWTGSTQTVTLPAGKWVDPNNKAVTKISIPNLTGTFVRVAGLNTAQAPSISPRNGGKMTGPVTVTISDQTPKSTIYYTLNGSTPTSSSPVYTAPFQLHSSTVVTARALAPGYNPSFTSTASLDIVAGAPTVEFESSSDTVPATGAASVTAYYPVLSLSAVPDENVKVSYSIRTPQGAVSQHSVPFVPGETYRLLFPISLSGTGTWTVSIQSATGAVVGSAKTFELTRK